MSNPNYSNTRIKLMEAEHFLSQMKSTQNQVLPFIFNLSAFLAAARSIVDVMEQEFQSKQGFASWFCQERIKLWGAGFKELNHMRNIVVHDVGHLAGKISTNTSGVIVIHSGNVTFVTTSTSIPLTVNLPTGTQQYRWFWQFQGQNEPVTNTCDRYLSMLSKMVEDCEKGFWP